MNVLAQKNMKKKKSFREWIKTRKGQQAIIIITFTFIPLLLLFTFTYLPFGKMVEFSFFRMKYTGPRNFIGFKNYLDIFTREDTLNALKLSVYYLIGAIVQLVAALYFATMLSFKTRGGNFFKGAIFFPYLISGIAIGFIFKFFYTRGFVLDSVLQLLGFELENLPYWLKNTAINNWSLVFSSVWRYMGQNMVLFIGAIMSVDVEQYEAAKLDGANKMQQFKYIILPSIKTIVLLNLILAVTGSLSAFEPPYVITKGSNGTATYFVLMDQLAHEGVQKVGLASAMAVVLLFIILIITGFQKMGFKILFNEGDADNGKCKKTLIKSFTKGGK